jgi:hypothetical protein
MLLVGIVPERTALGPGLSPAVQGAIPAAIARVVEELDARGVHLVRRPMPARPDIWWEQ